MEEEGSQWDLVVPIPVEKCRQSKAQQWFLKQKQARFTFGDDWHLNGQVHVFHPDSVQTIEQAEVRFGQHPYKRGFGPVCLAAKFGNDDKWDMHDIQLHWESQTIVGCVGYCTVVFRVHPFQYTRIKRFGDVLGLKIQAFLGQHMSISHQKAQE